MTLLRENRLCVSFFLSRSFFAHSLLTRSFTIHMICLYFGIQLFPICMKNLMLSRAFTSGRCRKSRKKRIYMNLCLFCLSACLRYGKRDGEHIFGCVTSDLNFSTHSYGQQTVCGAFFWVSNLNMSTTNATTTTPTTMELINPNSKAKHNLLTPFWRHCTPHTYIIFGCRPFSFIHFSGVWACVRAGTLHRIL